MNEYAIAWAVPDIDEPGHGVIYGRKRDVVWFRNARKLVPYFPDRPMKMGARSITIRGGETASGKVIYWVAEDDAEDRVGVHLNGEQFYPAVATNLGRAIRHMTRWAESTRGQARINHIRSIVQEQAYHLRSFQSNRLLEEDMRVATDAFVATEGPVEAKLRAAFAALNFALPETAKPKEPHHG